jgi:tRNA(Ile)-lysidine synthase
MSRRAASAALVAARSAVERTVADLPAGTSVLVACSGGPDSLALAGVTAWVARRRDLSARAVVVDHGLQPGSDAVAAGAADTCRALGLPAEVVTVRVGTGGGPEAAARTARYTALEESAVAWAAPVVLLGHTREDQAETVLLRLARGSGARSLSAMAERSGRWRRPFLALPRDDVRASCDELLAPLGRTAWADPHNDDPDFARVRVRALLADLVADLGPGVVLGLARTADLLRADADALDAQAEAAFAARVAVGPRTAEAECAGLAELSDAVRTRVLRLMGLAVGCPPDELGYDHVRALDALVVDWHGQGEMRLPGGVDARRRCGRLCLRST